MTRPPARGGIAPNSLQFNLSRVVGPAVGGATLVYLGAAWSFGLNALSFLVLVGAFDFIRSVPPVPAPAESVGAGAVVAGLLIALLDEGITRPWLTYLPLAALGVGEAALGFGGPLWLAVFQFGPK